MRNQKIVKLCASLLLLTISLFSYSAAADSPYAGKQLSLSGFGTYQTTGSYSKDNFGAGVAVDYSFCKYAAVQVSSSKNEFSTGSFFQNISIAPVLRLPFGESGFAPYLLGGAGVNFQQHNERFYFVGGGLEYRFNSHLGVFSDYIYTFDKAFSPSNFKFNNDNGTVRAGIKFIF